MSATSDANRPLGELLEELERAVVDSGSRSPRLWAPGLPESRTTEILEPIVGGPPPPDVVTWFAWHNGCDLSDATPDELRHVYAFPQLALVSLDEVLTNTRSALAADYGPMAQNDGTRWCPYAEGPGGGDTQFLRRGPDDTDWRMWENRNADGGYIPIPTLDDQPAPTLPSFIAALTAAMRRPNWPEGSYAYPFGA